jgi:Family of unknown function (DUF6328)
MDLSAKIKTGLDEARMLVLGCEILVGFQFQAAFQPLFQTRPLHTRFANVIALLLMIAALGLLIAPSCQYIIAERGQPTRRMAEAITWAASLALFPFASALSLDIAMGIEEISGTTAGIAAGAAFAVLTLFVWYGIEEIARQTKGKKERLMAGHRNEHTTDLHKRIDYMLTGARTILPGIQALLGFQLAVIFTESFGTIPEFSKLLHGLALGFVALSVALLMAPAAYSIAAKQVCSSFALAAVLSLPQRRRWL